MNIPVKIHICHLDQIVNWCFICAIILLPFNGLGKMPAVFGEFSVEGAFYPIAFGMVIAGVSLLLNTSLAKQYAIEQG